MKKDLKKELNEKGLKATEPREHILSVFSEECNPMSAEMVRMRLGKKDVDLVTVYRTLGAFEECGLLKKVDLHKDSAYYELNHHHHHIVCTSCGVIEEIGSCDDNGLIRKAMSGSSKFKIIQDHSLEFFGICKECVRG